MITRTSPGRYCVAALMVAGLLGWLLPFLLVSPWLWAPAAMLLGVTLGNTGYRLDRRHQCRPSSVKTPAHPPLLSPTEFARVCESYATPQVDPEPELPDPVPLLSETAEQSRAILRSPYSSRSQWQRYIGLERECDAERDELIAQLLVAERAFTLTTHCPKGHVATHWIGALDNAGRVWRTCRFTRCAAEWLEGR